MPMDKTIRKTTFKEMKADEYRYWQSVSSNERTAAAWELIRAAYIWKGQIADGERLDRSLITVRPARG